MWEKLQNLWLTIDRIPTTLKTVIIFLTAIATFYLGIDYITNNTVSEVFLKVKENKKESEDYTKSIAPKINAEVNAILNSDTYNKLLSFDYTFKTKKKKVYNRLNNFYNCLLLINYHNSTESINGLSYLYMTTLAEAYSDSSIKKEWREVYYIDYASELDKIHKKTATIINVDCNNKFPLLSKRLKYCNSKYSVWFTLRGVTSEIGVLVIIYKNEPPTDMVYYSKNILDGINRLTTLLDYENRNSYK